jgi:hypothetical protein
MSRLMFTIVLVAGLSASAMLATAASKPLTKPKKVSASVNATLSTAVPGACTTGTTYAGTCPGASGTCTCITVNGNATGGFGKGPVSGALTLDNFDATPETGCTPFFGSLALTNSRESSVTTMDVTGALCNAILPAGTKTIGAGFDFDPATTGLSGTGSVSGSVDTSGTAKLKLVGAIAPSTASPTPTAAASPTATSTEAPTPTATATPPG